MADMPHAHPPDSDRQHLQDALDALDSTALPLGLRGMQDAEARSFYRRAIRDAVAEIRAEVERGDLTPEQGAARARDVRNEIMELTRTRSSDIGRALAERLKQQGKTLEELTERYAQRLFSKPGAALTEAERGGVMREIIAAAARDNPRVSGMLRFLGPASRGLVALTVGLAILDVYRSPDRPREALHQGVPAGSGTLGSYAAGALGASLVCGPGAPVCVGIFVIVGGVGFTLGADFFWRRLQPGDGHR